jgi:hypothetical protein
MSASTPPPEATEESGESDLTHEEEDEILLRASEVEKNRREGRLIPHEALFPPHRLAG